LANCPTRSIMYVPLQVNRFEKSILLIVEYKYLKSCSGDFVLQNLILHTRSCVTGFITQSSWVFHFHLTIMVRWNFFVRQLYQFRRGISGGPALKYFYIIHRGGRSRRISQYLPTSETSGCARHCFMHCTFFVCCEQFFVFFANDGGFVSSLQCLKHQVVHDMFFTSQRVQTF